MIADTNNFQEDSQTTSPSNNAWVEKGILYNEYVGEVSVKRVLENEEKSMEFIREHKIQTIPMIVIFKNIDKSTFKLGLSDYSNVISTFDLSRHVSGAWIVGATPEVKKLVDVVNKVFFAGRMHMVDSVEEAEQGAQAVLSTPNPKTLLDE